MINLNTFTLILIMLITCTIGAIGAIQLKKGAQNLNFNKKIRKINQLITIIKNKNLIFGIFLYAIALIITIYLLQFVNLSIIYPLTSITYIFTIILSHYMLNEKITKYKWLAVLLIISGNALITIA